MKIRHKGNGGLAEVEDAYAERLIAGGGWERADAPKRRPKKAADKPKEAVADEG